MNVAVISDTHLPRGTRALPAACLDRLRAADLILHAGDLVALPVLDELRALGPPVHAVHGNMDDAELRSLLPRSKVVEAGGARIGIVHDPGPRAGREERLAGRFPDCDAVVYGHTHEPDVTRAGTVWILNPGSPTERRRAPTHTMLVLELDDGEIRPELVVLDP
ncbi:MAG TPA: metallophosphoesterase family protein [Gaiellaceae bacterium]|nr:metallophosphoesterase family protein [Gaiellaceae bacterium]